MNREDLDRLAVKAGFPERSTFSDQSDIYPRIERFAELVRADEREACAKVADGYVGADPIAAAIRARKDNT